MSDSPLRQSIRAARANFGPGLVLQAFATALVAAYYLHTPSRAALEKLAAFRTEIGLPFALVSTAVFGALIPAAVLRLMQRGQSRHDARQLAALVVYWAYKGLEVSVFYAWQARWFGEGRDVGTVALKTFNDQLIYCPLFAAPVTWMVYTWVENGFSLAPLAAEWRRPGWYARCVLPLLVTTWVVWVPAVAVIYILPTALQLPLQNVVLCFFTLMVIFMTRRPAAGPRG